MKNDKYEFPIWIKLFLAVYFVCGFFYLAGAFVNASLDIKLWTKDSREICVCSSIGVSIIFIVLLTAPSDDI